MMRLQRGFTVVAAVFILVVFAALGAFMVQMSTTQSTSTALDVQGSRAYHAARAGMEWAVYKVLDPTNATVVAPTDPSWPNLPTCPVTTTWTVQGFSVTVSCTPYPSASGVYNENGTVRSIRVYQLTATASSGTPGSSTYIERQYQTLVSKCRATDGAAPDYVCL